MSNDAMRELINAYGRACRRDGNPAWESEEGQALEAALAAPAQSEAKLVYLVENSNGSFDIVSEEDYREWPCKKRTLYTAPCAALADRHAPTGADARSCQHTYEPKPHCGQWRGQCSKCGAWS